MRVVLCVVIAVLCWQVAFAGTAPELDVLSHEWDFGSIEQGSSKEKSFLVKNKGFDELVIDNIHSCCGYGLKTMSNWTIAPGAKAEITIVCDASRKPLGRDTKYVEILSNCVKNPHMRVAVKADIVPGTMRKVKKQNVDVAVEPITETEQVPSLTVDEIYDMVSAGKEVFILDVREKEEYTRKYISNSIRFARSAISESESDFENILRSIGKRVVIAVCCASGIRSDYITHKVKDLGYKGYNMEGGILAWEMAGYPLVSGPGSNEVIAGIPINLEEAYNNYFILFRGETLWLDLRDRPLYEKSHIKGAINIPLHELKDSLNKISKDKHIILYCSGLDCKLGQPGSEILINNGFKRGMIRIFSGGIAEWQEAGYPTDTVQQ
jgi:rhodanese-related sulfurtransferase